MFLYHFQLTFLQTEEETGDKNTEPSESHIDESSSVLQSTPSDADSEQSEHSKPKNLREAADLVKGVALQQFQTNISGDCLFKPGIYTFYSLCSQCIFDTF